MPEIAINQGGGPTWVDYFALLATMVGVGAAIWGLLFARRAWLDSQANLRTSEENLKLANEGLTIAKVEHDLLINRLNRYASFEVFIEPVLPPSFDGAAPVAEDPVLAVWRIQIFNVGDKTAGETTVIVHAPPLEHFQWSDESGNRSIELIEQTHAASWDNPIQSTSNMWPKRKALSMNLNRLSTIGKAYAGTPIVSPPRVKVTGLV